MDKGLLQKDVAVLLGVTEDCVRFWEDGSTALPTAKQFPALIAFIGYYPLAHETNSIAGKVRQFRYAKGLTYEQCAEVFGVNASTIGGWELGRCTPNPRSLALIHTLHAELITSFLIPSYHETEHPSPSIALFR